MRAPPLPPADAPATPTKKVGGRTAVVTGGSQGVGKALTLLLARQGWNVVVVARQPDRVQQAAAEAAEILGAPERVLGVSCDVSDVEDVDRLARAVAQQFSSLDLLINNAGACCAVRAQARAVLCCAGTCTGQEQHNSLAPDGSSRCKQSVPLARHPQHQSARRQDGRHASLLPTPPAPAGCQAPSRPSPLPRALQASAARAPSWTRPWRRWAA
jgi:hypothetical protein